MRVLITGASGMLGSVIALSWREAYDVYATGSRALSESGFDRYMPFDLRQPSFDKLLEWANPDVIVNCAAITDVEYCEKYPKDAHAVNAEPVRKFSEQSSARIIAISSDAVFPVRTGSATEVDPVGPVNEYGKSKLMAERLVAHSGGSTVVRTTPVGINTFGTGRGLVEWMLSKLRSGDPLPLYDNVVFTPISIWRLASELRRLLVGECPPIVHISGGEPITKCDFGVLLAKSLGHDTAAISAVRFEPRPDMARRIRNQSLDSSLFAKRFGVTLPSAQDTVNEIAASIVNRAG